MTSYGLSLPNHQNYALHQLSLEQSSQPKANSETYEKIGRVYAYCAGAIAITCASALLFSQLGLAVTILNACATAFKTTAFFLTATGIALLIGIRSTPKENSSLKAGLYGTFAVWQGLALSPLVLINAPAFIAASVTTTAVVGGLGALSMTLKESFEKYEKILMVALGAIALASLGSLFLPAAAASVAHSISYVGGFAVFTCLVIYDTHIARKEAANPNFDEINHALEIYLDGMNLLVRFWECFQKNG